MKIKALLLCLVVFNSLSASAQRTKDDSTKLRASLLDSVFVSTTLHLEKVKPLPAVKGTYLFSGKKTESIHLAYTPADISNKTGRQVFAKIPGAMIYDMDGSGNQINISARGLDPHRGWEFNTRKDGIITNSDMYGYPASHFSMPLESIERIELVRGTGSLQYGAQFGGMLNYITKQGDTSKPFSFENTSTIGSYNLWSNYSAISGKKGKFSYYAYYQKRGRKGYRDNEETRSEAQAIILNYAATAHFNIRLEWARSQYRYRLPGALTDSMFLADPTQATRSRNYYSPDIHLPSLTINWQLSSLTKIQFTQSAVLGNRSSVLFDKPTNVKDTINATTNMFNNRQVDIDQYHSYTTELRILQCYSIKERQSNLAAGIQFMNNDLHRLQMGKGTTGSNYDLSLVIPGWGRDVHLKTTNWAFFAENKLQLTDKLSINAGFRMEAGATNLSGKITYYPDNEIPVQIKHNFPLFGAGFSYKAKETVEFYGGWAQAYHPMYFKDLIPSSIYEKVDPAIKDAKGYNLELGSRGNWRNIRWDINLFQLSYQNRFGTLAQTDPQGNFITWRTNIGNSITRGLEFYMQADWYLGNRTSFSVFNSTALFHSTYGNAVLKSGTTNINIKGNKVEGVPPVITRTGISFRYHGLNVGMLYSYTAASFADALNTVEPLRTTGAVGKVPAYGLLDINTSYRFNRIMELKFNVNNVFNKQYFTKRPAFYPGPGVWPSDGINFSSSISIRL